MTRAILQVYPQPDYKVYLYFATGEVRLFDVRPLVGHGIFAPLSDPEFFLSRATVLNHTLAWDLSGEYDPRQCLDLDPSVLYEKSVPVEDPLRFYA